MCVFCNAFIIHALSSYKNYYSQGFRYAKSRQSSTTIYLKCGLFLSDSYLSFAKIAKISNLLEVTKILIHSKDAHNLDRIVCNNIKRRAEISTINPRDLFTTVVEIRM